MREREGKKWICTGPYQSSGAVFAIDAQVFALGASQGVRDRGRDTGRGGGVGV